MKTNMPDEAPQAPKEQGEKQQQAPAQTPDEARREEQKAEVREKYGDDKEVFGTKIEASEQEKPQKIAFGKAVVEEFSKLLERRIAEMKKEGGKQEEFARMDEQQIKEIKEKILPQIEANNFDVIVQPAGLIAVETSDRRITLNAPNANWDKEFRAKVEERTKGSAYAERVFSTSAANAKKWKEENK